MGGYSELDFQVDGQRVGWAFDDENPDIAVLKLRKPLATGEKAVISTPFTLKIPSSFSRLGHVETSYQMTQWYPKPAVYDHKGWHAMPYLDMGEFYSEFGNFDVTIELPSNYVVGASGVLQTESEIEFLRKRAAETREKLASMTQTKRVSNDPFPESATERKTIRYIAEKVHDFAWFADKRFYVVKDTAVMESGRTIDCWGMFTESEKHLWEDGAFFVKRSVEFYSAHVGEYPWPQATALHSALSAGGGMEYPMITVIGNSGSKKSLDEVITHEVGHNWFYGILASNERDHPFMDEGLNSYYENRYMREYYGGSANLEIDAPKFLYDPAAQGGLVEVGCMTLARDGLDTPAGAHSEEFDFLGYGLQVYMKTALVLRWLEKSVGTETFDKAMKAYYQDWKFKHPYPEDLKKSWENAGLKADWFFESMMTQKQSDIAITRVNKVADNSYLVKVRQKGALNAPYSISAVKDGKAVETRWFGPMEEGQNVIEFKTDGEVDAFVSDLDRETLDINRKNDQRSTTGVFPGIEPISVSPAVGLQSSNKSQMGIVPWIGWNQYDNTIVGLAFHNAPIPRPRFQYYLAPGFGTGSGEVAGIGDLRYTILTKGFIDKITLGFNAKTFNYNYDWHFKEHMRYYRLSPQVEFRFNSKNPAFVHDVRLRSLHIDAEFGRVDTMEFSVQNETSQIYEIRYKGENLKLPNPWSYSVALEQQSYELPDGTDASYVRASAEWKQDFFYKKKRSITARLFAGYFLDNTRRNAGTVSNSLARGSFALNPQGFNDYRFDQFFYGRTESSGILSRQVTQTQGGFKNAFGSANAGQFGNSNNFILALNLKADLPVKLPLGIPLKPWFDIGYFDDATPLGDDRPTSEQFVWSGGFMLEFGNGIFEVYFPVVNSESLRNLYKDYADGDYSKWITWSIRLDRIDPLRFAKKNISN